MKKILACFLLCMFGCGQAPDATHSSNEGQQHSSAQTVQSAEQQPQETVESGAPNPDADPADQQRKQSIYQRQKLTRRANKQVSHSVVFKRTASSNTSNSSQVKTPRDFKAQAAVEKLTEEQRASRELAQELLRREQRMTRQLNRANK